MDQELAEAFWANTKYVPGGCTAWTGPYNNQGYGVMRWHGKTRLAHRVSLELFIGRPIKEGYWACHLCNNKFCCHPYHLSEQLPSENAVDSYRAGLSRHKLTPQQRRELLLRVESGIPIPTACKEFGVARNYIADRKYKTARGLVQTPPLR